ncbi:MAG: hypothetical protein K8R87_11955 [Verrucomicrobia bacterium]|nr:hypothetical protein [Verrucomicrobiota bacterium]
MRGSPLLQCLISAIAFALFAIPLVRLTVARPNEKPANRTAVEVAEPASTRHTFVRIRFAHLPHTLSLKQSNRELIPVSLNPLTSPIEIETSLPITQDSLELALAAQWPDGTPDTAITVELEPDELDTRRETRWSSSFILKEILNFKW